MPKVTATQETEVTITTSQRKKLDTELAAYADINEQIAALEATKKEIKARVADIREEIGAEKLDLGDGWKITLVTGVTSKLDQKKLISLGCKQAWIERATVVTPKEPYILITTPKEK